MKKIMKTAIFYFLVSEQGPSERYLVIAWC